MKSIQNIRHLGAALCVLAAALLIGVPASHGQNGGGPSLGGDDEFNKGARTTFQFLKIGVGARQAALGGASIAAVRDVNSAFWNPAGLSGIESMEVSFSYIRWLADMNYVAGATGYTWDGIGTFALSVASLNYGDIQEALVISDADGNYRTDNSISGSDLQVGMSFSRMFTGRLAIGVGVKFVRESLWDFAANGYAFDIGTNYDIGYNGTRLAMSVQNYSPQSVAWALPDSLGEQREAGYDMPLVFRVGLSTQVVGPQSAFMHAGPSHSLLLLAEAINTNDFGERLLVGGEYTFADLMSLRGGYRFNYAEGNWALGFGLHPELSGMTVRIDYAYAFYEFLSAPHRLSMTLAF